MSNGLQASSKDFLVVFIFYEYMLDCWLTFPFTETWNVHTEKIYTDMDMNVIANVHKLIIPKTLHTPLMRQQPQIWY